MTRAVIRTSARAPAHQMKIGRRSASQPDHPSARAAGSTAGGTRSATTQPAPQRRWDDPGDQLGLIRQAGRLQVAARGEGPGPERERERPKSGAVHVKLDAEARSAEMESIRRHPVRPDRRDTDLTPLEEQRAKSLSQELWTPREEESFS